MVMSASPPQPDTPTFGPVNSSPAWPLWDAGVRPVKPRFIYLRLWVHLLGWALRALLSLCKRNNPSRRKAGLNAKRRRKIVSR